MSAPAQPAAQSVGVVTGLLTEAESIPANGPRIYVSAGNALNAYGGAMRLAGAGALGLVSFGVAGGLDPRLIPGTLVLACTVLAPDGTRYDCDERWRRCIAGEALGRVHFAEGLVAGRDAPILSAEAKAQLYIETGAAAVDMESHGVARAAHEAKIPFLAVRVIADPARRCVPDYVLKGIDDRGRTRAMPVLAAALIRPWTWAALMNLARDHAAAMATLRKAGRLSSLFAVPV